MLRYYQQDAVDAAYRFCDDHAGMNPCVVLPTGAGKTHVIVKICQDVEAWEGRVLVLAHVKELLQQATEKLEDAGLDVGVYSASLKRRDRINSVLVAGIQSVYRRGLELAGTRPFNLVIVDEAHRIPVDGDGMYVQLLTDLQKANPRVRVIGLTATPFRTKDGYVCGPDNFLNEVVYEISIKELIAGNYLSKLSSKSSVTEVSTDGLKIKNGDFDQAEMELRFDDAEKVTAAVSEIVALSANRKKVLVFCCGIGHADHVRDHLAAMGQSVAIVSSQHAGRDQSIEDFKAGRVKYLVNINVLTEGFDAPDIDCVVLLRATVSPGLYYQMVGRGLRIDPSKTDCLVLDFGGNVKRHGMLDELNIKPKSITGADGESPVKTCPECQEIVHAGLRFCSACGFEFPAPAINHEASASDDSPMETPAESFEVTDTGYTLHVKKDTGSRSMRVTYYSGVNAIADEWICIEHAGFAYEKAWSWWNMRSDISMPKTVEEAIELTKDFLVETVQIKVKKDGRFSRIVDYTFGEPKESPVQNELGDFDYCEDDIPF